MIEPAAGAVINRGMSKAARQNVVVSELIDISAAAVVTDILYHPTLDIAIEGIDLVYVTAGAGGANHAELNVGTYVAGTTIGDGLSDQDADNIVDAHVIDDGAAAGDVENVTLASTIQRAASGGPTAGSPVVPAGSVVRVSTSTDGANSSLVQIHVRYSYRDPGQ